MSEETNIPAFPEGTTQEEIEQVRRLMNAALSSADTELFRIRLRATRGDLAAKRIVEIEAALIALKVKAARATRRADVGLFLSFAGTTKAVENLLSRRLGILKLAKKRPESKNKMPVFDR
jgi:hypothetical protein